MFCFLHSCVCLLFVHRMLPLSPWQQSDPTVMKSMPRPSSGSRKTPKHLMRPGRSACQQDVCTVLEQKYRSHVFIYLFSCELLIISFSSGSVLVTIGQETVSKPQGKAELRKQYLLEKYVWKWKQFMRSRKGEGLFPRLLKLSHNNWLRQVEDKLLIMQCCWLLLYYCCSVTHE